MTIFALFLILINVMFFLFLIYWYNKASLQTNLRTYGYYQENLALHNQLHMLKSEHQYQIVTLNNEVKRLNDILEQKKAKSTHYLELEKAKILDEKNIISDIFTHPSTYYYLKESCMSPDEASFLYYITIALSELIPGKGLDNYEVFPQYALHSIISMKPNIPVDSKEYEIAQRNFTGKSLDFVICYHSSEKNELLDYTYHSYTPILAIELDGLSHYTDKAYGKVNYERIKRSDNFKTSVFSSVGINVPLIRYTPEYVYKQLELIQQYPNGDEYKTIPSKLSEYDYKKLKFKISNVLFSENV